MREHLGHPAEPRIMINGVWLPDGCGYEFIEAEPDLPLYEHPSHKFPPTTPGIIGIRIWRDITETWRDHEYCDVTVTRRPGERPVYKFRKRPDVQTFPDYYAPAFSQQGDTVWMQTCPLPDWAHRSSLLPHHS